MQTTVRWTGDRSFAGRTESGHEVTLGVAHGNAPKPGPSPMELLLIGTGGCSAYDVVSILQKGREAVEGCVVDLDADRAETEPKVFTRIHMHFVVTGRGLSEAKVRRAIELSVTKYCSASAMLAKTAALTHDFEIVDPSARAQAGS